MAQITPILCAGINSAELPTHAGVLKGGIQLDVNARPVEPVQPPPKQQGFDQGGNQHGGYPQGGFQQEVYQ